MAARSIYRLLASCFVLLIGLGGLIQAQGLNAPDEQAVAGVEAKKYRQVVSKAIQYLENSQADNGSFSESLGPAVTAMCTTALLENGVPRTSPLVQKSLNYLQGFIQADGGVYAPKSNLRNYETSVAVMCFVAANDDGRYDEVIRKAIDFQKNIQWDDAEGYDRSSTFYGGQGYGKHKRPDMSNTSFFIDALKAAGEDSSSEAVQKAVVFMSRAQNLPSQYNDQEYATHVTRDDRGGFIYTPVGEGETKVQIDGGKTPEGGLRSYASMTYAGLKSFLYAGLSQDDIRVQAAKDWISRHYDLQTNPGMGLQGLYYYYHVFAKALDANGERTIVDANGNKHNWRADLLDAFQTRQHANGSWTNEADRWYEGDPNLVTSYCLLALKYCHPDKDQDR